MALKANRKRIVIDASVARSAGGEDATNPTSKNCRNIMRAILDICHHVVFTDDILDEWKRHQSKFATSWRVRMVARKKFVKLIVEDDIVQIKITEKIAEATREVVLNRFEPSLSIRTKIANTRLALEAMLKDFHLLEAALATDQIVISLDETSRYLFAAACQQIGEIREIMWVHPDEAEILDWLNDGAKSQPERQLRKYEPNKD